MSLDELIAQLIEIRDSSEFGGNRPVRIAYQPNYPMSEELSGVSVDEELNSSTDPQDEDNSVYLTGTGDNRYAPHWVFDLPRLG